MVSRLASRVRIRESLASFTPVRSASGQGVRLIVVKIEEVKRGFVLLPRRWVVECSFASAARFRRLGRDDERLSSSLAGLH